MSLAWLKEWCTPDSAWVLVLYGVGAYLVFSVVKLHRKPDNDFNLLDLVMRNGRISIIRFSYFVVLLGSTWVILKDALTDAKVDSTIFAAWLATFAAPIVSTILKGDSNAGRAGTESGDGLGGAESGIRSRLEDTGLESRGGRPGASGGGGEAVSGSGYKG